MSSPASSVSPASSLHRCKALEIARLPRNRELDAEEFALLEGQLQLLTGDRPVPGMYPTDVPAYRQWLAAAGESMVTFEGTASFPLLSSALFDLSRGVAFEDVPLLRALALDAGTRRGGFVQSYYAGSLLEIARLTLMPTPASPPAAQLTSLCTSLLRGICNAGPGHFLEVARPDSPLKMVEPEVFFNRPGEPKAKAAAPTGVELCGVPVPSADLPATVFSHPHIRFHAPAEAGTALAIVYEEAQAAQLLSSLVATAPAATSGRPGVPTTRPRL